MESKEVKRFAYMCSSSNRGNLKEFYHQCKHCFLKAQQFYCVNLQTIIYLKSFPIGIKHIKNATKVKVHKISASKGRFNYQRKYFASEKYQPVSNINIQRVAFASPSCTQVIELETQACFTQMTQQGLTGPIILMHLFRCF